MKREFVILLMGIFLIAGVCAEGLSSDTNVSGEWWMFGKYLNHTSWDGVDFPTIFELSNTSYTTGRVWASCIYNGTIYVSAGESYIYQLNASNISQLISLVNIGTSFHSLVLNDKYLYGSASNYLYQLNASNISQQIANYTSLDPLQLSPIFYDESVYLAGNYIYQLNASNISQQIANYSIGGSSYASNSAPAKAGDYLYVSGDDYLYQLNASNISQQIANYDFSSSWPGEISVLDNYVYLMDYLHLYQLNASNISQQIANYTTTGDGRHPLFVSRDFIIFYVDNTLYQLNASNISQQIANYTLPSSYFYMKSIVGDESFFYLGTYTGSFLQFNASNVSQLIATSTMGDAIFIAPILAKGYIYEGSDDGKFYQLTASNISFFGDAVSPSVPLIFPINGSSFTGATYNITFQYNVSDESEILNCYLVLNNGTEIANQSAVNKSETNNLSVVLANNSYDVFVKCYDVYNNSGVSSNVSFTITAPVVEETVVEEQESSSGGGSSNTVTSVSDSMLENGFARVLNAGMGLKFNLGSESHNLKLNSISDGKINFTISSEPQSFVLSAGESVKVDADSDDKYDIVVSYLKNYGNRVELKIEKYSNGEKSVVDGENASSSNLIDGGVTILQGRKDILFNSQFWAGVGAVLICIAGILGILDLLLRKRLERRRKR